MSWKYKIGILYIGFVVMILFIVGLAYRGKVELVDANYYQKEIQFQKTIDAIQRGLRYEYAFQVTQNTHELIFHYPEHLRNIPVKVHGYCYSDASKDFRMDLVDSISKSMLRKGNYKVSFHWGTEPLDTLVEIKILVE